MTALCNNPFFDEIIAKIQQADTLETHEKSVCVAAIRSFSGELAAQAGTTGAPLEQAVDVAVSMLRAATEKLAEQQPRAPHHWTHQQRDDMLERRRADLQRRQSMRVARSR